MTLTNQPLITQLLRFVRRADTERSATRILAEISRFIAQTFLVHRVAVCVFEGTRLRPLVAEYASGQSDPALWDAFRSLEELEATPPARRLLAGEDTVLVENPHGGGFLPKAIRPGRILRDARTGQTGRLQHQQQGSPAGQGVVGPSCGDTKTRGVVVGGERVTEFHSCRIRRVTRTGPVVAFEELRGDLDHARPLDE